VAEKPSIAGGDPLMAFCFFPQTGQEMLGRSGILAALGVEDGLVDNVQA
jgi:hypothetical protein